MMKSPGLCVGYTSAAEPPMAVWSSITRGVQCGVMADGCRSCVCCGLARRLSEQSHNRPGAP